MGKHTGIYSSLLGITLMQLSKVTIILLGALLTKACNAVSRVDSRKDKPNHPSRIRETCKQS